MPETPQRYDTFISPLTPRNTPEAIAAVHTGREKELNQLTEAVKAHAADLTLAADPARRNWLILLGPRGAGKSHLVTMTVRAIEQDSDLAERTRVAFLGEEGAGYDTWNDWACDLLERLAERYPAAPESAALRKFLDGPLWDLSGEQRSSAVEDAIRRFVGQDRLLVVIQENLEKLIGSLRGETEKLLAFLDTLPCFFLAGSASVEMSADEVASTNAVLASDTRLSLMDTPLGRRFTPITLTEFTYDEAKTYLLKVADFHQDENLRRFVQSVEGGTRIRVINELAGGMPRIWAIFADIVDTNRAEVALAEWERISELLTTYYQERFFHLPSKQARIIRYIANHTGAMTIDEIAKRVDQATTTVIGTVKELIEKGLVRKFDNVRSYYELREPLFRLYIQTKQSQGGPIKLLVDFLTTWFTREELQERMGSLHPERQRRTFQTYSAAFELYPEEEFHRIPVPESELDGQLWELEDQWDSLVSEERWSEALVVAETLVARRGDAWDYYKLGYVQRETGQYQESADNLKVALDKDAHFPRAAFKRAESLIAQGNWLDAQTQLRSALKITPINSQQAEALRNIAIDMAKAGEFQQAQSVAAKIERSFYQVEALNKIAIELAKIAERQRALKLFQQAQSVAANIDHDFYQALALNTVATELATAGEIQQAINTFKQAQNVAIKIKYSSNQVTALSAIARELAKAGEKASANHNFQIAQNIVDKIQDRFLLAQPLSALASALASAGDIQQALSVAAKIEHNMYNISALSAIARELAKAGETQQSINIFHQAQNIADKIGYSVWQSEAFGTIATELAKVGETQQAIKTLQQAQSQVYNMTGSSWYAEALSAIATELAKAGEFQQAQSIAIRIEHNDWQGLALTAVVTELATAGEIQQAQSVAANIDHDFYQALALNTVATELATAGEIQQAINTFKQAQNVAIKIKYSSNQVTALSAIARELAKAGEKASANHNFQIALDIAHNITSNSSEIFSYRDNHKIHEAFLISKNISSETLIKLLEIYRDYKNQKILINGLIQAIESFFTTRKDLSDFTLGQWRDNWNEIAGNERDFEIPLRLLDAAVQWRAKPDARILLRLPLEERRILEQMLPEEWRGHTREVKGHVSVMEKLLPWARRSR